MKWLDAFRQIDKPTWTNRDASGVIEFAKAAFRTYAKQPNVALTPWDWYPFSLPALGWFKPGDRFKVDTKWQLQPYQYADQLRTSLQTMAKELDAANVPAKVLVDPRGTDAGYRKLAVEAWEAMKQLGHEGSHLPGELLETWAAQIGPTGAAAAAASASSAAAAATAPKKKQPEQMPLPGVEPGEAVAQPVDMPVGKKPTGGAGAGAGVGILLLLAAFAFGGGRKRGRR